MTTQIVFADMPSRLETMTGLTSDQVDRLVLAVYTYANLDPARRRAVGPTAACLSHRASVERVIAHLKNWRLRATGYRGLLDRFPIFLDTITKLEIYRIS